MAMGHITMEVLPCDPVLDGSRDEVTEPDARCWIDIQTDPDVHEAMLCDVLEDM